MYVGLYVNCPWIFKRSWIFSTDFSKTDPTEIFKKIILRVPDFPCGWVDGPTEGQKDVYNEVNNSFSKLCERSYKCVEEFVKCAEKGKFDTGVLALEHSECYSLSRPTTLVKPASFHLHIAYLCLCVMFMTFTLTLQCWWNKHCYNSSRANLGINYSHWCIYHKCTFTSSCCM
jgi:hypothetical protein